MEHIKVIGRQNEIRGGRGRSRGKGRSRMKGRAARVRE